MTDPFAAIPARALALPDGQRCPRCGCDRFARPRRIRTGRVTQVVWRCRACGWRLFGALARREAGP